MNSDELKSIIREQEDDIKGMFDSESLIDRSAPDLLSHLSHPNILAILGVRRCGKSTLALQLVRGKKFAYINFDDERLYGMGPDELDGILEAFYSLYGKDIDYLIFDEIQNIKQWELFINRLRRTKRLIITGSNANLLSGDLATHLTGRYVDYYLLPLSFREFIKLNGQAVYEGKTLTTYERSNVMNLLETYIKTGGFPEATLVSRAILPRIYKDILIKDGILHFNIRKRKTFSDLARYLISNRSCEFTYSKLGRILGISNVHTVKDYVEYLCDTNLLFYLERYSSKLKSQFLSPKKAYCIDTGMAASIGFNTSENMGHTIENLVAVELMRRNWQGDLQCEMFYWKDEVQHEVDFVIRKGMLTRSLIQVCYSIEDPVTRKRELRGLVKASMDLDCDDLSIITWNTKEKIEFEGKEIRVLPLFEWLMENNI